MFWIIHFSKLSMHPPPYHYPGKLRVHCMDANLYAECVIHHVYDRLLWVPSECFVLIER